MPARSVPQVIDVTDATLNQEVLSAQTLVMLDVWGDWCEPCKALDPLLAGLARTYAGKLKICRLNVGSNPRAASAFHIESVPTLLLFQGGRVVGQHVGGASAESLTGLIETHLSATRRHR
ncbi:MAG: thioredoxin domain-containing protein [Candidatus Eisenbacteria bacterium]